MKTATKTSYQRRITRVMEYIHSHLFEDLDVNTLANIALMSPYHFHRVYRELAQETVNGTVRRLRLQQGAAELIRSELPISSIAKQLSYGSIEAFSRAFTKQFGETPSEYRESRLTSGNLDEAPFIAMLPPQQKVYSTMYNVEITTIEPLRLMTYDHQGDYMNIGGVFEKLFIYASSQELMNDNTRSIGLYYDDPQSVELDQLRSKAGLTIDKSTTPTGDDAPEITNIPGGKCVSLLFKGSYAELEKPYNWLFGEWLPNSGHEPIDFPPFEEYLNDPKTTPPSELLTRIHCLLSD